MQSRSPAPLSSEHRLHRLQTWLGAMLAWAAVHLIGAVAPALAAGWLKQQRRRATILLVVRAMNRFTVPLFRGRIFHRRTSHRVTIRRMAGSRFRRALKARTPEAQVSAIQHALANAERWIAAFLRRFAQRFTRLTRFIHTLSQDAAPPQYALAPRGADSS